MTILIGFLENVKNEGGGGGGGGWIFGRDIDEFKNCCRHNANNESAGHAACARMQSDNCLLRLLQRWNSSFYVALR